MTTRDHFRIIIDDLAAKAKATLPENAGRIDAAVALVLAGDVALQPDGLAIVGSATSPLTTYPVNGQCACPDYPRAPQSWCKHRIARAMALRAERAMHALGDAEASRIAQDTSTLAQTSTPAPEEDDPAWHLRAPSLDDIGMVGAMSPRPPRTVDTAPRMGAHTSTQPSGSPDATSTILEASIAVAPQPPMATLPEAPASVNVRLMLHGRECQLTLRDSSEERLLARLATVLARFPVETPALVQPPTTSHPHVCQRHGTMKESTKAKGTWYCPAKMADGSYCTERWPAKNGGRR